jgi:hypothetical protein
MGCPQDWELEGRLSPPHCKREEFYEMLHWTSDFATINTRFPKKGGELEYLSDSQLLKRNLLHDFSYVVS